LLFRFCFLPVCLAFVVPALKADVNAGHREFDNNCSVCHGGDLLGGELGPPIAFRLFRLSDEQIATTVNQGLPNRGMPAFPGIQGKQLTDLVQFLRSVPRPSRFGPAIRKKIETTDGQTLEGEVLSQSLEDLELKTNDGHIHLLRAAGEKWRPVTSDVNWSTYNGNVSGNRYTTLTQINKNNIRTLVPKWVFTMNDVPNVETTPLVVDGFMYVTSANECYAIDAGNGRQLWHFQRPRTRALIGNAAGGFNRGVAWAGKRIFMVTDNAHLLALDRLTGALLWDTEMADWHLNYNATSAPLVVGDLVITGTAGGEQGARGFVAAFDQATGKEVWRLWTVPKPGEPGSETWQGKAIEHGAAVAWFTGSYDPVLDTLYWQTGNPGPDYNGSEREGDNLYSDSILALDPKTGKMKWYYQFTPHDVHDWDATEPALLIDADWQGQPRKLLAMANRNGFFYVLDRTNGKLLLAKPFVRKLNWASEIDANGRPVLQPMPKEGPGVKVCPAQDGATNWYSASYIPATQRYYVQTLERCSIYTTSPVQWEAGRGYGGGSARPVPNEVPQKFLRAIDIHTGKIVWESPEAGLAFTFGGTLATATDLVFSCDDSGMFIAVDASTGKTLWHFQANQPWRASPIAYSFDGKELIAVASGQTVMAFGEPE
jgi:alcohol dehydrogenase (cytochrome c)